MNKYVQNNNYYSTRDENFEKAVELLENNLTQERIIDLLKNGNIAEKQIAALQIDTLENSGQAEILLNNLVDQDGKIREVVSLKLIGFIEEYPEYFVNEFACSTFLKSVIDVNPNICRNIICIITKLKYDKNFCKIFIPELLNLTNDLIKKVSKIDFKDGKYKINKEVFKLYWCLETIYELTEEINLDILKSIIHATKGINEYTIREKTAKILSKNLQDDDLKCIQQELRMDENYYVRRF